MPLVKKRERGDEPDDIGIHAARLLGQMIGDAPALLLGGTAGRALLGTAAGAAGASLATTGVAEGMGRPPEQAR